MLKQNNLHYTYNIAVSLRGRDGCFGGGRAFGVRKGHVGEAGEECVREFCGGKGTESHAGVFWSRYASFVTK